MKLSVAFLLVLSAAGLVAVSHGQTKPRGPNQNAVNKPRNETLRICQGVPVPEGYVIIAYMTSAACPHGAYLLKKQNDYESSLAVNGSRRQTAKDSEESPQPSPTTPSGSSAPPRRTQSTKRSVSPAKASARSQPSMTQPSGDSAAAKGPSITRPRRVGSTSQDATASQNAITLQDAAKWQDSAQLPEGPPSLMGSEPARTPGPPSLTNKESTSDVSSAGASSGVVSAPGSEEVGEGDVVRVNTSLVAVPVSVLDRQGRFIANLKREDFQVFENGVEQSIAYFEPAEKPFTVALLLDTSPSTHFHLWEIKEAAIAFAKQLRPQDRVLIVSFNNEVLLLTELTNDLNLIEAVIEENANTGNSTRLYDAVDLTIRERLNKIKGRKAIVLFTDGVDTSSEQATYQSTLGEVDELDALIYPIQYDTNDYLAAMQGAGNGAVTVTTTQRGIFGKSTSTQTYNVPVNNGVPLPGTTKADYDRADRYLHALADMTGGRLYQAHDTAQLAQAFAGIAEELRRQYSLGYYPKTDDVGSSERREIKVRVRQPGVAVKARNSYVKSSAASPNK